MTLAAPAGTPCNIAHACCGRWAADRARFALYAEDAAGATSAWTFWDIQREANRLSNVLAALGVARGECVAIAAGRRPETAVSHIACYQMGAVAVPFAPTVGAEALAAGLGRSAARAAIVEASALETLANVRERLGRRIHVIGIGTARAAWARTWADVLPLAAARYLPADTRAGEPALRLPGIGAADRVLTQRDLLAGAATFAAVHGAYPQPGDLFWSPAGWDGVEGLCGALLPVWRLGQPILGYSGAFDPEKAFWLIEKYGIRNTLLSPAQLGMMMAAVPAPRTRYALELRSIVCKGTVGEEPAAWALEQFGIAIGALPENEEGKLP